MKKLFLFFVFTFFCVLSVTAQSPWVTGAKFLTSVVNQDWDSADSYLSHYLKSQLKDGGVKKLFSGLSDQIGKLQSFDTLSGGSVERGKINKYVAHFTKQTFIIQIALDDSSKIAGFYLLPMAQLYKPPSYAISSAIETREIAISSGSIKLKGLLSLPVNAKSRFPLVIFIGGSGPSDEDETMGAEKPFKDISLALASHGIGSLRYSKRTATYPGEFKDKNYTINDEYLDDITNIILYAKNLGDVDSSKIFILGHSEGGMLAPLILKQNPIIAGAVLLEANARPIEDLIYDQSLYLSRSNNGITPVILQKLKLEKQAIKNISEADSNKLYLGIRGSYWFSLNKYNPTQIAKSLKKPNLLIVQGGKDYQVTEKDYIKWKESLGSKRTVEFRFYPKINHALVETDGSPSNRDYDIPRNVPFYMTTDISNWIRKIQGQSR